MTIVALWYQQNYKQIWCAADSRVTGNDAALTDAAPKIFPVQVLCHRHIEGPRFDLVRRDSYGFAFAGSTLAAISSHALIAACTQNLFAELDNMPLVGLDAVAELARWIGETTIRDMSSRQNRDVTFEAVIFGFCPVSNTCRAFVIVPNKTDGSLRMVLGELLLFPPQIHLLGSGTQAFLELRAQLAATQPNPNVMTTLATLVQSGIRDDVGGHLQVGVASQDGFSVLPVLEPIGGPGPRTLSFLGLDVRDSLRVGGLRVGFFAAGEGPPEANSGRP